MRKKAFMEYPVEPRLIIAYLLIAAMVMTGVALSVLMVRKRAERRRRRWRHRAR